MALIPATVGEKIIRREERAKTTTTRKIRTHPTRCPSLAPVITNAATTRP